MILQLAGTTSATINNVEPGLLGFIVVAALAVALVFLLRSMTKHLKKIGPKPEELDDADLDDLDLDAPEGSETEQAGTPRP